MLGKQGFSTTRRANTMTRRIKLFIITCPKCKEGFQAQQTSWNSCTTSRADVPIFVLPVYPVYRPEPIGIRLLLPIMNASRAADYGDANSSSVSISPQNEMIIPGFFTAAALVVRVTSYLPIKFIYSPCYL